MATHIHKTNNTITAEVADDDPTLRFYRADDSAPVPGEIRAVLSVPIVVQDGPSDVARFDVAVEPLLTATQFANLKSYLKKIRDGALAVEFDAPAP
jgi:hypothetical protein